MLALLVLLVAFVLWRSLRRRRRLVAEQRIIARGSVPTVHHFDSHRGGF